MNAVSTTARFIAEVELTMFRKLFRHLLHRFRRVWDHTDEPHRSIPAFRPSSATLMEMVALWTSMPTNDLMFFMPFLL
jgi:hypothetical protein